MTTISFRPSRRYGAGGIPREVVDAMWTHFQRSGSLLATGKAFGRAAGTMSEIFARRGLRQPPAANRKIIKGVGGRFVAGKVFTDDEIVKMIALETRVRIPRPIRNHWRQWPAEKRAWLLGLLWAQYDAAHPENRMPAGPFSANVEPFDYTTPRAQEIARKANAGLPSRLWTVRLFPSSRGVIARDDLWFWDTNGYHVGEFRRDIGRPYLHHVLWREQHGVIPRGMVIRFRDGNSNNLTVENMVLRTRERVLRENQSAALTRDSRAKLNVLLAGNAGMVSQISALSGATGKGRVDLKSRPNTAAALGRNPAPSPALPRKKKTYARI